MLKLASFIIFATAIFVSPQAALASDHQHAAKVCFNSINNGSDGVDIHQRKMARLRAEKESRSVSECMPAEVYLGVGSNGTDGVDLFQEKMARLRGEHGHDTQARRTPAKVYLNVGSNGSDGVDYFQDRIKNRNR
ncbi:hypothetical protein [Oceanisphaera sp.]|uniref:hypothetical protein n=1 Tax=Oceanisphaera sp. TaxID=1929979 RepID=UPI003A941026